MTVRTVTSKVLIGAIMAVAVAGTLSACSDASDGTAPDSKVTVYALCNATESFKAIPSNFNTAILAETLGVPEQAIKNGGYVSATCNRAIPEDGLGSGAPSSIVNVDRYSPCLAIGTQSAPVAGASTKEIVAVCPGNVGDV